MALFPETEQRIEELQSLGDQQLFITAYQAEQNKNLPARDTASSEMLIQ